MSRWDKKDFKSLSRPSKPVMVEASESSEDPEYIGCRASISFSLATLVLKGHEGDRSPSKKVRKLSEFGCDPGVRHRGRGL